MGNTEVSRLATFVRLEIPLEHLALGDEYRYASLPLCIIDAVFSTGVRREAAENVVLRYCEHFGVPRLQAYGEACVAALPEDSVSALVQRFEQAAKMMKTVARGGVPNIPGMGPVPGGGRPGASAKRGKQSKTQKARQGSRSGNPAKRAAENAGLATQNATPTGSGFGLGGGSQAPSEADLAELQKLLGKN